MTLCTVSLHETSGVNSRAFPCQLYGYFLSHQVSFQSAATLQVVSPGYARSWCWGLHAHRLTPGIVMFTEVEKRGRSVSSVPLRIVRDSKHEPWGTPTPGIMIDRPYVRQSETAPALFSLLQWALLSCCDPLTVPCPRNAASGKCSRRCCSEMRRPWSCVVPTRPCSRRWRSKPRNSRR